MRRPRTVVLVAVSLAATALGACGSTAGHVSPRRLSLLHGDSEAAGPALYPQRPTAYVLDGSLADLGSSAPVRRLIGHELTTADLARIGGALGMHGTPVRTETGWELSDGAALLTAGTTSGVTFVDYGSIGATGSNPGSAGGGAAGGAASTSTGPDEPSSGAGTAPDVSQSTPSSTPPPQTVPSTTLPAPVDVPSPDDAVSIAQALLHAFGVLSGQQWSHDVSDVGGIAVSCSPGVECGSTRSPVTARSVGFRLVVDGVRVPSVGWSVTIGEHRLVASVSGTWARPEVVGTYALRPPQSVFGDLQRGDAHFVGPQPLEAAAGPDTTTTTFDTTGTLPKIEVHITGVALGLALWNGVDNGQDVAYLVPTYRFHALVTGGSPYDIELLALDPADFALTAATTTSGPPTSRPGGGVVPQTAPAPAPSS